MISLYPYQEASEKILLASLAKNRVGVDASDTGTGKTYVAASLVRKLGAQAVVICPKAVIPVWKRILELAGVQDFEVLNYEKLRAGNTPYGRWNAKEWLFFLPVDTILIWDEAHYCKGKDSQNARMLKASKPFRTLVLSASLAESPIEMRALGYLLGLHSWVNWYRWCLRTGCWKGPFGGLQFKPKTVNQVLLALHHYIFPEFGCRVKIRDLGDAFPECQISAEAYDLNDSGAIAREYRKMERELCRMVEEACENAAGINALAVQLKARQAVELLKVPGLSRMAQDLIDEGNSVVIFTNYVATLEAFCGSLETKSAIFGTSSEGHSQTANEREQVIQDFLADNQRVIIVNIAAGGVGISLNDIHGNYPRVSLICPTYNAKQLKQAFGRPWRSGGKSKVIQRIVFAAGTIEETICRKVRSKLHQLDLLNDGDLAFPGSFGA